MFYKVYAPLGLLVCSLSLQASLMTTANCFPETAATSSSSAGSSVCQSTTTGYWNSVVRERVDDPTYTWTVGVTSTAAYGLVDVTPKRNRSVFDDKSNAYAMSSSGSAVFSDNIYFWWDGPAPTLYLSAWAAAWKGWDAGISKAGADGIVQAEGTTSGMPQYGVGTIRPMEAIHLYGSASAGISCGSGVAGGLYGFCSDSGGNGQESFAGSLLTLNGVTTDPTDLYGSHVVTSGFRYWTDSGSTWGLPQELYAVGVSGPADLATPEPGTWAGVAGALSVALVMAKCRHRRSRWYLSRR